MSVMRHTAAKELRHVNFKEYYFVFFICMIIVSLTACKKEGPAERAGKKIDETVEKTGEKIKESTEKAGDKIEEAGDKVKEATKK